MALSKWVGQGWLVYGTGKARTGYEDEYTDRYSVRKMKTFSSYSVFPNKVRNKDISRQGDKGCWTLLERRNKKLSPQRRRR